MASSLMYNGQIILPQGDCSVERFNCTLERMNFIGLELFTLKYSVLGNLSGILYGTFHCLVSENLHTLLPQKVFDLNPHPPGISS